MASWRYTINVKNIWKRYEEPFEEDENNEEMFNDFKSEMVPHLQTYINKLKTVVNEDEVFSFTDILSELEDSHDLEDFNYHWNQLYEWADFNKIWIQTF